MFKRLGINLLTNLPDGIFNIVADKVINRALGKHIDLIVEGLEKVKKEDGPYIFIGNHLSNSDGLVINNILKKDFNPYFIAGVKLNSNNLTSIGTRLVKTINITPNSADRESLNKIVKEMKEGQNIVIFPEGTRSRTASMMEGKKGVLLIARLTKAKIVPFGMTGTEKLMPINDTDMGAERFNDAKVVIKFGEPIVLPKKEKEEGKQDYDNRALNYLMKSISNLLPDSYKGIYKD